MLGFGFKGGGGYNCPKPVGEYLLNHSFDCGTLGWGFDPNYPATITDNGDGSVHLSVQSEWGSLVPNDPPSDSADWICEIEIANQSGTGKISFRRPNGTWENTVTNSNGVHTATYSGIISELHVGADTDENYEADYLYISLRKADAVTLNGETVTHNGEVVTHG